LAEPNRKKTNAKTPRNSKNPNPSQIDFGSAGTVVFELVVIGAAFP
jgi:hypothetical protein